MRKIKFLFFISVLALIGAGQLLADDQIDSGQERSVSKIVFFIGRYARTTTVAANGNELSEDRVVVWDSTSDDGVTVNYSSTSGDPLVAGVTMDRIPGSSRDNSATNDLGYTNWGRIQTYGFHSSVSFDTAHPVVLGTAGGVTAGMKIMVDGVNGRGTIFRSISDDANSARAATRDSYGVTMDAPAAGDGTTDIFIKAM